MKHDEPISPNREHSPEERPHHATRHEWREYLWSLHEPATYQRIVRHRSVLLFWRVVRRVMAVALGGLILALSALFFTFNIQSSRDWIRTQALDWLNKRLAATVTFTDFHGNPFGGLTFAGVRIIAAGDTLLAAQTLTIRYDLQALLKKTLVVNRITLDEPVIKLLRAHDSTWNFAHIVLPAVDTTREPFPLLGWTVSVRDMSMYNGTVFIRDSIAPDFTANAQQSLRLQDSPLFARTALQQHIRFSHLRLDAVWVSLAATLQFAKQKYSFSINRLSFVDAASRFVVKNVAMSVEADTCRVEVFNARLHTAESALRLNAALDSINIFKRLTPGLWKRKPLQISINADSLSTADVQRFVPALNFLGGSPALKLEANGTYGDFTVSRLELAREGVSEGGQTERKPFVHITGRLQNFHLFESDPAALLLDTKLRPMRVSYADLRHYVPGLCMKKSETQLSGARIIPDLSALGTVEISSGSFVGTVQKFNVSLDAASGAGAVAVTADLDARSGTLRYDANATVKSLNLAPILRNRAVASNLNATIGLHGKGTTLKTLAATLHVESSASEIAARKYDYLSLNASARDGGYITVDMLKVLWNRRPEFDEDHYDTTPLAPAQLLASGFVSLQDANHPEYRLDARTTNLDIRKLAPELGVQTDATLQINVAGRGFHPDSLQGNLRIAAQEFSTPTQAFEPFTINVRMERAWQHYGEHYILERRWQLLSELADAEVKGEFTITAFLRAFASQVDNIVFEVQRKYHLTRDSANAAATTGIYTGVQAEETPLDVAFTLKPRDLSLVSLFTGDVKILGAGELSGSIRGTSRRYTTLIDSSYLDFFAYTDGLVRVNAWKAHLSGEFHNQSSGDSLNAAGGWATVRCDSAFAYDDLVFPRVQMQAKYDSEELSFDVASDYSSVLRFRVNGALDAASRTARLTIDTLRLAYFPNRTLAKLTRDELRQLFIQQTKQQQATKQRQLGEWFAWSNTEPVTATLATDGLTFEQFRVRRFNSPSNIEELDFKGLWWFDHFSNFQATARGMRLSEWNKLFPRDARLELLEPLSGWLDSMTVTADGTYRRPTLGLTLHADSVRYNGSLIGNASIIARHQDSMVTGKAEFITDALNGTSFSQNTLKASNGADSDSNRTLVVRADSFPLNLALETVGERIVTGRPIDVSFDAESFPMSALAQFVPGINNLRGWLQAHFSITGETQDNIVYQGSAALQKGSFITDATNLRYFADGKLSILNNDVTVESFVVQNDPLDYPRGRATATGTAKLRGFEIASFDLTATSPSLLVLGNASRITHPNLYGDVVIQNGASPIHFYGTLAEPYLRGDINILDASVVLPESKSTKTAYNAFCYETIVQRDGKPRFVARDCPQNEYTQALPATASDKTVSDKTTIQAPSNERAERVTTLIDSTFDHEHHSEIATASKTPQAAPNTDSVSFQIPSPERSTVGSTANGMANITSSGAENLARTVERGLAERIDYDVNVNLKGNFFITMNFSPIDQLVASVAQENPDRSLRYVQKPVDPDNPKLFGNLLVRDGSKYNFYRIFNTTGVLAFTSGAMDNPQLSLRAVLRGQRISPVVNNVEEYTVVMDISGTKKFPQVKISYFMGDRPGVGDPVKVQNDAIMLMVFGKTQDELLLRSAVNEATTQTSSSAASKMLTDLLQGTGIIRSADIYFASAQNGAPLNLSQARVQLTGEIGDLGVTWQLGNDIGSNAALNPSFTVDIPLRAFLNVDAFRNVILQVNRSTVNFNAIGRQQRELEVKMTVQNRW